MSNEIIYTIEGRVATITLNRPEVRNALSPEVTGMLIQRIREAEADLSVKCIVIRGEGDHFSAGGDVKSFQQALSLSAGDRYDMFERRLLVGNRLPQVMLDCSKPIVVAARGAVAGAGMALCLAADFVLCSTTTYFLAAHVHVGLSLDCGLSGLLVGAMGIKAAKRLALLGERVNAEEALDLGIVTKVVDDSILNDELLKLTDRLAAGPATAMAGSKHLLNAAAYPRFVELLAEESAGIARCAASEDFAKGVESVLTRKPASFS